MQRVPVIYLSSSMEALLRITACSSVSQWFAALPDIDALLVISRSPERRALRICHSVASAAYASKLKAKCAAVLKVDVQRHVSSRLTLLAGLLLPHRSVSVMELHVPADYPAVDYQQFGAQLAEGLAPGLAVMCFDRQASRASPASQQEMLAAIRQLQSESVRSAAGIPETRALICAAVGLAGSQAPSRIFDSRSESGRAVLSGCAWA